VLFVIVLRKSPKPVDRLFVNAPSIGLFPENKLRNAPLTPEPTNFDPTPPNTLDKSFVVIFPK